MPTKSHHVIRRLLAILIVTVGSTMFNERLDAQVGTAFTYQGHLESGGNPFSGTADFEFRLFHQATSATQAGPTVAIAGVVVTEGLFTADLDFGSNPFSGDARWLEIRVRAPGGGGGAYTTLAPRQRLSATPYAIYALAAGNSPFTYSGSNAIYNGGLVGIGTSNPQANLHVVGNIHAESNVSSFNPNNLTAALHLGFGPDANGDDVARLRIGGNGPGASNGLDIQRSGDASLLRILHNGNVGIGTSNPIYRLQVVGGSGIGVYSTGAPGVYGIANTTSDYGGTFAGAGGFGSGKSLLVAGDTHMLGFLGVGISTPIARVDVQTNTSMAVRGVNTSASGSAYGVFAWAQSPDGIGTYGQGKFGVYGFSSVGGFDSKGVYGFSNAAGGSGVHGHATGGGNSTGIYATRSGSSWAGYFEGDLRVIGNYSATGSKSFLIDHPLDPDNQYLAHSCVESDEMKNIYDGTVTLNGLGEAIVALPDWFEHLNADFRYQLTCVGGYAPVYVSRELSNGTFAIAGEGSRAPGLKVSWQITGNRIDPSARDSGFRVEIPKPEAERGKLLDPAAYGRSASNRIERMANPYPPRLPGEMD